MTYKLMTHSCMHLWMLGIQIGESSIRPSDLVRSLGVMFDKVISINDNDTSVYRVAYNHPKNIRNLKPFLSQDTLISVVRAFVISRVDYSKSFLTITAFSFSEFRVVQLAW